MCRNDPTPQLQTVFIFSAEQYRGDDWPPEGAVEFLAWFSQKVEEAPIQYHDSVRIEIDSSTSYGDSAYAKIDIWYVRPENPHEIAARLAEYAQRHQTKEAEERRQLALLAGKYGYTL